MDRTILVIGGTGARGQPVARRLQADGHGVRVLARSPAKARLRLGDTFEVLAGNVGDPPALARALFPEFSGSRLESSVTNPAHNRPL
jgi:uncharacterized protein YbjT (DUF2867 family)